MAKVIKKIVKIALIVLLIVALIVVGYVAYVFIAFHRLGTFDVQAQGVAEKTQVSVGEEYKIVSYNIGFGAYEKDYGFFMDGGHESWAWSKERLDKNLNNIADFLKAENAQLYIVQEVDIDSTRSYHVDERDYLTEKLNDKSYFFAQNYDSPFLFYPFYQPHGSSRSGLMTFSDFTIESAKRVELPIEAGLTKLLDLDRCYSKATIPVSDGKKLILYNFHLSAYTSDGKIATEQLKLLLDDVQAEYEHGNYCIAGGDFNKDILGDSSVYFGKSDVEYTWAQPIPSDMIDNYPVSLVAPFDENLPVPSCRNADSAYHEGQYVLTIDGFLITDNVQKLSANVIDTGFEYSDHNPVFMTFKI
ncbi:MAG: endonuclease/exonuclease/phosphatase family protein [Clostridia bacterium]|nr:endonuclease/exonuclease/phosphatase family protein [Clostridia bacterium]